MVARESAVPKAASPLNGVRPVVQSVVPTAAAAPTAQRVRVLIVLNGRRLIAQQAASVRVGTPPVQADATGQMMSSPNAGLRAGSVSRWHLSVMLMDRRSDQTPPR